jgi:hypothetical protein
MIGFEMIATSNVGFSNNMSKSQEGSSWLLKGMLLPSAPKGTGMFTPDLLTAVDSQFIDLRNILVNKIGGLENFFYLQLFGDFRANIRFHPEMPASMKVWRFLNQINLNAEEMGVHVMKALCEHLLIFDDFVGIKYAFGGIDTIPILKIEINL